MHTHNRARCSKAQIGDSEQFRNGYTNWLYIGAISPNLRYSVAITVDKGENYLACGLTVCANTVPARCECVRI